MKVSPLVGSRLVFRYEARTQKQVQRAKRKGDKKGGDQERVATEDVLEQIYNYYCFEMCQ